MLTFKSKNNVERVIEPKFTKVKNFEFFFT